MLSLTHTAVGAVLAVVLALNVQAEPVAAEDILQKKCGTCHAPRPEGSYSRIFAQRKTPEGWYMTLFRMHKLRKVELPDEERAMLIKYLADTQGLAPEETAGFRYAIERESHYFEQYNSIDNPDPEGIAASCTQCHSYARSALQRRSEEEWRRLVHFHVGQFPALEYQMVSRMQPDYWQRLSEQLPAILAAKYPLESEAWKTWRAAPKADLSGSWRIVGHLPGSGFYSGIRTIERTAPDRYSYRYQISYADGRAENGQGSATVYTGYEWRGTTSHRSERVREAFQLSRDGNELGGRWFRIERDELGGRSREVRMREGQAQILAVEPSAVRVGETGTLTIHGYNLAGAPDLGPGITARLLSRDGGHVVVQATVSKTAKLGQRSVKVGSSALEAGLAVYSNVDFVRVEPEHALARLGDGGGKVNAVSAQFDAFAYSAGADGKANTADDLRLGWRPAKWTLEPWDETAQEWEDEKFAGKITDRGLFVPAAAGINPNRKTGTVNNTGNLRVRAAVQDNGREVIGTSHLVVTSAVLWVNPPIK